MTLLETMAALLILAMMIALVGLRADRLSASWSLKASAHQIENVLRFAQNAAAVRARNAQVLYDIPQGAFWVRIRGDEARYAFHQLPTGVSFDCVRFTGGAEVRRDVAGISAYPAGTVDPHEVVLKGPHAGIVLRISRLTGDVEYRTEDPAP